MHFSDLGADILCVIFSIIGKECNFYEDYGSSEEKEQNSEEYYTDDDYDSTERSNNYKQLVEASSVCRLWRSFVLPYLYAAIYVKHIRAKRSKSNVKFVIKSGNTNYVRSLSVKVEAAAIETLDLVGILDQAGLSRTVWPRIKTLSIYNLFCRDIDTTKLNKNAVSKTVAYLNKCLPNITKITYWHNNKDSNRLDGGDSVYPYVLLPGLLRNYSNWLYSLDLSVSVSCLAYAFLFPEQLTHLTISMRGYEKRIIPRIPAKPLRYLKMTEVAPDITWSWFCSDDGQDSKVWFCHLKTLVIEFSGHHAPELTYHNGDHTSKAEATKFRSDYYNDSKTSVCFPILENLQISYYPYKDESFYRLFEHCPLKLSSVNGVRYSQHGFPTQILANLERMSISVNLKHTGSLLTKKKSTETAVAQIMTSFSSAQIASLSSIPAITISLPKSIGWTFVKRLYLLVEVDMPSIYTILGQMFRLQYLHLCMYQKYLDSACNGADNAQKQLPAANKRLDHLVIFISDVCRLPRNAWVYLLVKLLPLVPSLLKLEVHSDMVNTVREIVADANNSLNWISGQLEIVGY